MEVEVTSRYPRLETGVGWLGSLCSGGKHWRGAFQTRMWMRWFWIEVKRQNQGVTEASLGTKPGRDQRSRKGDRGG